MQFFYENTIYIYMCVLKLFLNQLQNIKKQFYIFENHREVVLHAFLRVSIYKLWHDQFEWRPSWICPIWRPQREPSLASLRNQNYMTLAISGPKLVLLGRFEQSYDYAPWLIWVHYATCYWKRLKRYASIHGYRCRLISARVTSSPMS